MNNGFIFIHRKIKEHWIWKSDNRLKWWLDILLTVNYLDNKVLIGNNLIECNRGQSIKSLESWAKDWNVTKKTVRDFFLLLEKDGMIIFETQFKKSSSLVQNQFKVSSNLVKNTTRITVCNFDSYQNIVNAQETVSKRIVNGEETVSKRQQHTNKEYKKRNKENKENKLTEIDFSQFNLNGNLEKYINLFNKWLNYKAARKESYKSIESKELCFQKLLNFSKENYEIAEKIINDAMSNNYAGFFEPKNNIQQQQKDLFKIDNSVRQNPDRMKFTK